MSQYLVKHIKVNRKTGQVTARFDKEAPGGFREKHGNTKFDEPPMEELIEALDAIAPIFKRILPYDDTRGDKLVIEGCTFSWNTEEDDLDQVAIIPRVELRTGDTWHPNTKAMRQPLKDGGRPKFLRVVACAERYLEGHRKQLSLPIEEDEASEKGTLFEGASGADELPQAPGPAQAEAEAKIHDFAEAKKTYMSVPPDELMAACDTSDAELFLQRAWLILHTGAWKTNLDVVRDVAGTEGFRMEAAPTYMARQANGKVIKFVQDWMSELGRQVDGSKEAQFGSLDLAREYATWMRGLWSQWLGKVEGGLTSKQDKLASGVGAQIGNTLRLIDRLLDEGYEEVASDA